MIAGAGSLSETIVARATPPGEGAIAIVRLAGERARDICDALQARPLSFVSHQMVLAELLGANGQIIDQAMVVQMHAPHSYTGDDVVELHLHGGRLVVAAVLDRCMELGARTALPGEFTLRAFLNGKMDLAQAEAVGDLISAGDAALARAAAVTLQGALSSEIDNVLSGLQSVLVEWRASMDYPEHDSGAGYSATHLAQINAKRAQLFEIIKKARIDLAREHCVVLCGAPNAGKSTLLNALAGTERVLVHDEPGTTRDVVEVSMLRGGRRWSLVDTAGIRSSAGDVEAKGIELALHWINRSEVAIWLIDPESPQWPTHAEISASTILVGSKADLACTTQRDAVDASARERGAQIMFWVSGHSGEGIERLLQLAVGADEEIALPLDEPVITRERQLDAARRAHDALVRLHEAHAAGLHLDILCKELEDSTYALGEILGRNVDLEVLDSIFTRFCIGK